MAVEGVIPRPDVAIFADTGWEPEAVYQHLGKLEIALREEGIPLHVVTAGNMRADALARAYNPIPVYTATGMGRRQCTNEYKLAPIRRKLRELLGAPGPDHRYVPRGNVATQWVGFSTDEVGRANRVKDSHGVLYLDTVYPLLDMGMSRKDCQRWLAARQWTTQKSACIGCPFHGNRAWRALRDTDAAGWADAVAFDNALRPRGEFLHASRLPLDRAPIDHVTRREWDDRQVDLLDLIAEEGDPNGCSPYGCRSE